MGLVIKMMASIRYTASMVGTPSRVSLMSQQFANTAVWFNMVMDKWR